jgi:hypothetical protein
VDAPAILAWSSDIFSVDSRQLFLLPVSRADSSEFLRIGGYRSGEKLSFGTRELELSTVKMLGVEVDSDNAGLSYVYWFLRPIWRFGGPWPRDFAFPWYILETSQFWILNDYNTLMITENI